MSATNRSKNLKMINFVVVLCVLARLMNNQIIRLLERMSRHRLVIVFNRTDKQKEKNYSNRTYKKFEFR